MSGNFGKSSGSGPGQDGRDGVGMFQFLFGAFFAISPSLLLLGLLLFAPVLQTLLTDSAMPFEADWWKGVGGWRKF